MEESMSSGKIAITVSLPENLVNRLKRFSNTHSPSQITSLTLRALLEGRIKVMPKPVSAGEAPQRLRAQRKTARFLPNLSPQWQMGLILAFLAICSVMIAGFIYLYVSYQEKIGVTETTLRSYEAELLFRDQSKQMSQRQLQQLKAESEQQKIIISDLEQKLVATEIDLSTLLEKLDRYDQARKDAEFQALKAKARIQAKKLKRLTGETPPPAVPRGEVQIRAIPPIPKQKPDLQDLTR